MKCPACQAADSKVIDSRLSREEDMIRRRRECISCGRRFTTYEKIEENLPLVVKKNGERQAFSRQKILDGIDKACHKRSVSAEERTELVERAVRAALELGEPEAPCSVIGEVIMQGLKKLDDVAYVRFASVYKDFRDVNEFVEELNSLVKGRK
ncbi:MAG: transcriptional regulator NrdR [Nitrospinota bacterium]|nr:transcriptional regulator NrdR [Nitrospinota bacterium]MDH5757300.1 transcriptional regulator NrdR [Nitrospinota bacterium]